MYLVCEEDIHIFNFWKLFPMWFSWALETRAAHEAQGEIWGMYD